jgi:hypothetical protein
MALSLTAGPVPLRLDAGGVVRVGGTRVTLDYGGDRGAVPAARPGQRRRMGRRPLQGPAPGPDTGAVLEQGIGAAVPSGPLWDHPRSNDADDEPVQPALTRITAGEVTAGEVLRRIKGPVQASIGRP